MTSKFRNFQIVSIEKSIDLPENEFSELMFELYQKHFNAFGNCSKQVQHLVSLHKLGVSEEIVNTLKELGLAMITAATTGYEKQILEIKDIKIAAKG